MTGERLSDTLHAKIHELTIRALEAEANETALRNLLEKAVLIVLETYPKEQPTNVAAFLFRAMDTLRHIKPVAKRREG